MRRRRPGRDSVVSGASSIASTENRLWRIRGWRLLALAGLAPAGRAEDPLVAEGMAQRSAHGAPVSQRARPAVRARGPPASVAARHRAAPTPTSEVGIPSVEARAIPHDISRHGRQGQHGIGDGHHDDDPHQRHVEHLGLAEDGAQGAVGDLVERRSPRGRPPGRATTPSGRGPAWPGRWRSRPGTRSGPTGRTGSAGTGRTPGRCRSRWSPPGDGPPMRPATIGSRTMMSGWTPPMRMSSITVSWTTTNSEDHQRQAAELARLTSSDPHRTTVT